jgi:hypothetical protein
LGSQRADQAFIEIAGEIAGVIDDAGSNPLMPVKSPLIPEPSNPKFVRAGIVALIFIGAILIYQIAKGH